MKILLSLITILIFQLGVAQKVVYFPGFELINMEPSNGLQYSTSKLIKSYIEDNQGYTILLDERIGANVYLGRELLSNSIVKARELDARYFMTGEIHYLQGVYIISLGVYETATREQVWHDMAKGAAEQDLDPLLSRLGRSFFTSRTAKTDIEIDEVTEYDQMGVELAQIKVNHFVGVMLGGKVIPNESTISGFGLAYTYDASTVLFNFDFELFPSSTLSISHHSGKRKLQTGNISLGVTYPLTRKRSTLYVNGGMEYGYTTLKDRVYDADYSTTEAGIGAFAGGGVMINRNSTVNLRIFTAISVPFYRVDDTSVTGFKFGIVTSFARKN
ncbi:hypothetical protein [Ekhidna sp.]|uniref:hypothetical protein n=1 Tax=Ekhidna sp. TaxID=2608089 RepID=UPI003298832C